MRHICLLIILLLLGTTVNAQEVKLKLICPYPAYKDIDIPDPLKNYTFNDLPRIPGTLEINYIGLHRTILGQITRRVKGQARDNLRSEYHQGAMDDAEFTRRMQHVETTYNAYGEWWDRSWMYSLPPERGGAPKQVYTQDVGWDIGIPRGFPILWWCKQRFDSIGDIWIDGDREFADAENTNRLDNPGNRYKPPVQDRNQVSRLERTPRPDIGISGRDYRWYEGSRYHLRFRPTMRFRPTKGQERIIDEITLRMMVELYGQHQRHWADIVFFIRHDMPQSETYFSLQLQVGGW